MKKRDRTGQAMPKIHFLSGGFTNVYGCGHGKQGSPYTKNPKKVTCKTCITYMIKNGYIALDVVCKHCSHTLGSHHYGTVNYPHNYCPGTPGKMDWENGPGTCFKPVEEQQKERKEENA